MNKYTIDKFNKDFPNDATCLEWLKNNRWPNGIFCKKCNRITKHHRVKTRPAYACDPCGNHVYPLAGTIMEKSTTSIRLWFYAMYLMASTRCGISAKQLEREIGVTYKTAWRIFKQIRTMLDENVRLEGSSVEVDETYIGGRRHGKRERGSEGKSIVIGMAQREGKIVAKKVMDISTKTIIPLIRERILPRSIIYTDEMPIYNALKYNGYIHKRIHHASKVYVMGDIHTNSIEGFWSLFKRGVSGAYHAISDKYLQSYLNEFTFRYNHRNNEVNLFEVFLSRVLISEQDE